jgi:aspartyl aminopeptidase
MANAAIDLNLENYDLNDLLALFKLEFDFNAEDLKRVKKTVMQTHPDKSQLDKKYFLFFTSAYKIIFSIYEFRHKSSKNQATEYTVEKDEEKELLLKSLQKKPNFNKIFNELFEKHRIKDDENETGYGDWFKSDENMDSRTTTLNQMNATFEQKKREVKELIPYRDVEEMGQSSNQFDLTRDKPEYYTSALFSSLQYEDLKKAHVESVIPVTHEDYLARPKFKNVLELQADPTYNDTKPLSLSQAKDYLQNRHTYQAQNDVQRAYKLAKQDEVVRKANEGWMSGFKQILG